jgi:glycosyltransferase involved in cell wall biosynthesis
VNFIGSGEYAESKEFISFINSNKLDKVLNIIKYLPHNESLEYICNSDVLLLLQPSKETMMQVPAKAFEYIRSGNFIFTLAPQGATHDLVRNVKNGIVADPDDISSIKKYIYEIYMKYLDNSLVRENISHEIQNYDRREQAKKLANLLDGVYSDEQ